MKTHYIYFKSKSTENMSHLLYVIYLNIVYLLIKNVLYIYVVLISYIYAYINNKWGIK